MRVISNGKATRYLAGIQGAIESGERPHKTPIADYVSLGGLPKYDVRLISPEYHLSLSLYDLPGELFTAHAVADHADISVEALTMLKRAISGCVGFVYIVPYEDQSLRGEEWEPAPIPHVLLTHLQELHKSERHPIPIACVLSKADLSPEISAAQSAREAHELARRYMSTRYAKIVDTLDSLSTHVNYFATSAFGRARADKVTPDRGARPRWVLDPIDWLCSEALASREALLLKMFGSVAWSAEECAAEFRFLLSMTLRYDQESDQLPRLRSLWSRCLDARARVLPSPTHLDELGRASLLEARRGARAALKLWSEIEDELYLEESSTQRHNEETRLSSLNTLERRRAARALGVGTGVLLALSLLVLGVYQLVQHRQTQALTVCAAQAPNFNTLYACDDLDHLSQAQPRTAYMKRLVELTRERSGWSHQEARRGFERVELLESTARSLRELDLCQVNTRFESDICVRYGCDTPEAVTTRQELTRACASHQRSQRTLDECVTLQEGLDTWDADQDGLKRCADSLTRISYTPCDPTRLRSRCQDLAAVMLDELKTKPYSVSCHAYVADVGGYLSSLERAQGSAHSELRASQETLSQTKQSKVKVDSVVSSAVDSETSLTGARSGARSLNAWLAQVRVQLRDSSARCQELARRERVEFERAHAALRPICEPDSGALVTLQRAREQRDHLVARSQTLCDMKEASGEGAHASQSQREGQHAFCQWSSQCVTDLNVRLDHFTHFEERAQTLSELSACQPAYLDAQSFLYDSHALKTRCYELARRRYNEALSSTGFKACHAHLSALSDYTLARTGVDARRELAEWLREAQTHCEQVGETTERLLELARTRLGCEEPQGVTSLKYRDHIAQLDQLARSHCPQGRGLKSCRELKLCQQHFERCERFTEEARVSGINPSATPSQTGLNACARFVAESERLQCNPVINHSPCERALRAQLGLTRDAKTSYTACVQALKTLRRYPEALRDASYQAYWAKARDRCTDKLVTRCQRQWSESRREMTWSSKSLRLLKGWRDTLCERALISHDPRGIEWSALRERADVRSETRAIQAEIQTAPRRLFCAQVNVINDHIKALVNVKDERTHSAREHALSQALERVEIGLNIPFNNKESFRDHLSALKPQLNALEAIHAWRRAATRACEERADDQRSCYQFTIHRVRPRSSRFNFCNDGMAGGVTEAAATLKLGTNKLKRERSQFGFSECRVKSWMNFNEGAGLVYLSSERALIWNDFTLEFTEYDSLSAHDTETFVLRFENLSYAKLQTHKRRVTATARRGSRLRAEFEMSCALINLKGETRACYPPLIPSCE